MPRRPRLRRLTVFLLKEDVDSWERALRSPDHVELRDLRAAGGVDGVAAIKPPDRKPPWWREFLAPHLAGEDDLAAIVNSSTAAVLLLHAGGRRFALAFGYGRHLLQPDSYEHDFGLRVVVNVVEPDRLKSVDARTMDELTMHTRLDASRESSFSAFGLDVTRDLVRSVTGQPRDETLAHRVTGSDSLAIATRATFEEIPGLCERLVTAYESEDYKEHFDWIDQLRRVKDPAVTSELDEALVADLQARELTDTHLAPPEVLDWRQLPAFELSTSDAEPLPDPRISAYVDSVDLQDLSIADLKRDRVTAVGGEGEAIIGSWSVYKCLVYETRRAGELYVLTAGDWYAVDPDFATRIANDLNDLDELDLELPDAPAAISEPDYNELAGQLDDVLSVDRALVRVEGRDPVELCDLLTMAKQLIHVKRRGGSSTLSHLFSQGNVSGELLFGDEAFRRVSREVVESLDAGFTDAVPAERPAPGECEISFAVITRSDRDTPLTLPFFSQVNLRIAVQRLQRLGYRVTLKQINELDP